MCQNAAMGETIRQVYASNPIRVDTTTYDITETARRNVKPGGPAATLLFSRGVQAIMVYTSRVT